MSLSDFNEIKYQSTIIGEGDAECCLNLSIALWELIADNQTPLLKKTATDGKTFQRHLLECINSCVNWVIGTQRILDTQPEKYSRTTYDQKRSLRVTLRHCKESLNEAVEMTSTDKVPVIFLPKTQHEFRWLKELFAAYCVDMDGRKRFGSATEAIGAFLSRKQIKHRKSGKGKQPMASRDRFYVVGPFRFGVGSVVVSPSSYVWTELVTTWNAAENRVGSSSGCKRQRQEEEEEEEEQRENNIKQQKVVREAKPEVKWDVAEFYQWWKVEGHKLEPSGSYQPPNQPRRPYKSTEFFQCY